MALGTTLLELVQKFCQRQGLVIPTFVVNQTDETYRQIVGLLEEAAEDLVSNDWSCLHWRHSFIHANKLDYIAFEFPWSTTAGAMESISIIDGTLWDATNQRVVVGPLSPQEWGQLIVMNSPTAMQHYRVLGPQFGGSGPSNTGGIAIYPYSADDITYSVEFVSDWYVRDGTTGLPTPSFQSDTDTCVLPSGLLLAGLRWRWKKEKGLLYQEDKDSYQTQLLATLGLEGGAPKLNMGNSRREAARPGIFVPPGSWNL